MTLDVIALSFADADHKITRNDQGLVSLTDLWRAVGKAESQRPSVWANKGPAQRLIALCQEEAKHSSVLTTQKGGNNPGVWGIEDLAIDYAAWINPRFKLAVYRAFKAYWSDQTGGQNVVDTLPAALSRLAQFVITDISGRTGSDHIHFHPTRPEIGHHCVSLHDWCNATGVSMWCIIVRLGRRRG